MTTPDHRFPPGDPAIVRNYKVAMSNGDVIHIGLDSIGYLNLHRCVGSLLVYSNEEYDISGRLISHIEKDW